MHISLSGLMLAFVLLFCSLSYAQSETQIELEKLSYMIGDWKGISTAYENGEVSKQVSATESIHYALDEHIITIDLNSETLELHTVITYDKEDETYYYHPFSKTGSGKYPATYENGALTVTPNDKVRYIFTSTPEGNFTEYGERLVEGEWVKYFEDNFESVDE